MKGVLFVDDDPQILAALQNSLRRFHKQWKMTFACGGVAGREAIAREPFEVIVTDIRMAEVNGEELLAFARERQPGSIRIVLSGQIDDTSARRLVDRAHRFVAKPCPPGTLEQILERSFALNAMLQAEELRGMAASGDLPPHPRLFMRLSEVLDSPDATYRSVAAVIEEDPAICARILHVANSAYFGLPQQIRNVEQAVSYLGLEQVRALTLSFELSQEPRKQSERPCIDLDALQRHSLLTATLARHIQPDPARQEDSFIAGLLHDVGLLLQIHHQPERLAAFLAEARESRRPLASVEYQRTGTSHAELGAYLLGIWGLSHPIVEAVACGNHPELVHALDVAGTVYLADLLANEQEDFLEERAMSPDLGDEPFIRLGVGDRLEELRTLAAEELAVLKGKK